MDEFGRHYAKWNKLDIERQIIYDLTSMWNLESWTQSQRGEWWLVVEGWWGWRLAGYRIQAFIYKVTKVWGSNVHSDCG